MLYSVDSSLFRAFSAFKTSSTLTWGVAPGCYISRRWRVRPMSFHTGSTAPGTDLIVHPHSEIMNQDSLSKIRALDIALRVR